MKNSYSLMCAVLPLVYGQTPGQMPTTTFNPGSSTYTPATTQNPKCTASITIPSHTETLPFSYGSYSTGECANMNTRIFEAVAHNVEAYLNNELGDGTFNSFLRGGNTTTNGNGTTGTRKKDFIVTFNNQDMPISGGVMTLAGSISLTPNMTTGGELQFTATGTITSYLRNIEQSGILQEIPYTWKLEGSYKTNINATFTVWVKDFRVRSMSVNFASSFADSDVTAAGIVGNSHILGQVNLSEVSTKISSGNLLNTQSNVSQCCTGTVSTKINTDDTTTCTITPTKTTQPSC